MDFEPRIELHFDEEDARGVLDFLNFKLTARLHREMQRHDVDVDRLTQVQELVAAGVDEWLDSGRRPDGSESPADRKMTGTLRDKLALNKLLGGITVQLAPTLEGITPIARLSGWWADLPEMDAMYILIMVLCSKDLRLRLAKCRKCNRYFFLSKKILDHKGKQVWKNGCFCSVGHNSAVTARIGRRAEYDRDRREKIDWAAAELRRLLKHGSNAWYEDTAVKNKLVRAVNKQPRIRTDPRRRISVNFISKHKQEIHAKAGSANAETCKTRMAPQGKTRDPKQLQ
jgi:hypothetical protein